MPKNSLHCCARSGGIDDNDYDRGVAHLRAQPDRFAQKLGIEPVAGGPDCQDETQRMVFTMHWANIRSG